MVEWTRISLILCVFGFFRDMRPSEPYDTQYILGPWRNITKKQVNQDVYPIETYSYLAQLILIFLVTDLLRYKPLIILMSACGILIWSLLIWTTSLAALQAVEFFYGTYMALEVAYYTYIYAKVDKEFYQKVTSHARAALLVGKLVGSVTAQLLVYFSLMDYKELNYITLSTQICSMLWAFLLPKVDSSLYFHRRENLEEIDSLEKETSSKSYLTLEQSKKAFKLLWTHFYNAYTNTMVLQWSLWYIIGLCGHLQVVNYIQILWKTIDSTPKVVWNGAVDAIYTLLAAGFSLLAGYIFKAHHNPRLSLLVLAGLSIVEGLCLLLAAWTTTLYVSYIGYICFGALFTFTVTVSSAEVARYLEEDSYGLVFGFNTFIALILQTILTLIVVSKGGLALDVITQYAVYGFYFVIIGGVYLIGVFIDYLSKKFCIISERS